MKQIIEYMKQTSWIQKAAWVYFWVMVALVFLNFCPVFDESGKAFGLFYMKLSGDILHVVTGTWAFYAAYTSPKASSIFFRYFGTAYFLDGIVGMVFGKAYLNFNIFNPNTEPVADITTRLLINTPHVIMGGIAMILWFIVYRSVWKTSK